MASVPGVCGLLSTLFQIETEKSIVLKALSSNLNLVVVSDYDTSLVSNLKNILLQEYLIK